MRCVAVYRRSGALMNQVTVIKNARIRQIGTSEELGLGLGKMLFIQIERVGWGYDYYSASAYRALEVEI